VVMERIEVVAEASQDDVLAALTDLNDRLDAVEEGKSEPVEKVSLWNKVKGIFNG
jgi:hypothetical protein